jgi:predicted transcriptional regulator
MPQTTENVTVRMPPTTQKKLGKIAASLDRSRNWLINQAVAHYLELYDWQTERIRQRLHDAENGGDFIAHDDAMRRIEAQSNLLNRPISTKDDTLAGNNVDGQSRELWEEHKRRQLAKLADLKVGTPRSSWRDLDALSLRVPASLALLAMHGFLRNRNRVLDGLRKNHGIHIGARQQVHVGVGDVHDDDVELSRRNRFDDFVR